MTRHTFTNEERSKGGKKGYQVVTSKYEWGCKYLRKRMFHSYQDSKKRKTRPHASIR